MVLNGGMQCLDKKVEMKVLDGHMSCQFQDSVIMNLQLLFHHVIMLVMDCVIVVGVIEHMQRHVAVNHSRAWWRIRLIL